MYSPSILSIEIIFEIREILFFSEAGMLNNTSPLVSRYSLASRYSFASLMDSVAFF